ncbi:hypothetical protein DSO57_1005078 [Entomophthora muscae]|uniref:Uncharacterized protein n=1 Tax=Entomophthora muscae TaxID=34485 RepID=A0ACC2RN09_9FUNG|nr:hypothetical protein DSO57_1005078 [Entomophthora muscae]
MRFVYIPLLASIVAGTAKELGDLYNAYSEIYPNHACAVFTSRPYLGRWDTSNYNLPSAWVFKTKCERFTCMFTVCIPKYAKGEQISRSGDGGYENWVYNAVDFKRVDDRFLEVV